MSSGVRPARGREGAVLRLASSLKVAKRSLSGPGGTGLGVQVAEQDYTRLSSVEGSFAFWVYFGISSASLEILGIMRWCVLVYPTLDYDTPNALSFNHGRC